VDPSFQACPEHDEKRTRSAPNATGTIKRSEFNMSKYSAHGERGGPPWTIAIEAGPSPDVTQFASHANPGASTQVRGRSRR